MKGETMKENVASAVTCRIINAGFHDVQVLWPDRQCQTALVFVPLQVARTAKHWLHLMLRGESGLP